MTAPYPWADGIPVWFEQTPWPTTDAIPVCIDDGPYDQSATIVMDPQQVTILAQATKRTDVPHRAHRHTVRRR